MSKPDPSIEDFGCAWTEQIAALIENWPTAARSKILQAIICAGATLLDLHQGKAATYLRIVADELDRETKPPRQLEEEIADDPPARDYAGADPQTRVLLLAEENADLARQVNAAKRETRKKTAELGAVLELLETMKAEKEAKA